MPTVIMLLVMVGLIWFMQRSQKKQAQARQDQLKALQKGDEIVTIGGLYGVVDEVDTANQKMPAFFLAYEKNQLGGVDSLC